MKKYRIPETAALAAAFTCALALGTAAQDVENAHLTVTVPDEIAAICDIEANDDEIAFYESISHEAFGGGFVGSIRLYESVRDYGYMPSYQRGGQITLTDGTKLDVVLARPSDVQYDLQDEDSTNHYHLISDAFLSDITESIVPKDGVYTPQDEVDTTAVYVETLDRLRQAVEEKADMTALKEDGFSYLYMYMYEEEAPLSAIGCAYMDINRDGYDELLLGRVGDNAVYDLYTQLDGEVIHVFSGGERDIYVLTGGDHGFSAIKETGSGAADLTHITFYDLDPVEASLIQQTDFIYDGQKDPENPWSIAYIPEEDSETVSEEEWNERIGYFGEEMEIAYAPLG